MDASSPGPGSPDTAPSRVRSPRFRGSQPTPRAPRHSCRDTYSASPQPAKWPAGTHLKEGETEAQREPATSPRSHSAVARSRAGGRGLGAPVPAGRRSRSPPPSPSPAGYSQPVLPSSSRTSSDAEWVAPMVPAAGARVRSFLPGPGLASAAQRQVRPRVRHRSGRQELV